MLKLRRSHLPITSSIIPLLSLSLRSFSSSCKRRRGLFPPSDVAPPVPKRVPFAGSAHGMTWHDPYRWMSDTSDPDLSEYLRRENAYAEAFMADTVELRKELVEEMKGQIPATVSTPPERWGPWLYYQYIPEGLEYPILCRSLQKHDNWSAKVFSYLRGLGKEEILLNWNEIAEQYGYVHIGTCRVSPNHNFLAYTLDLTGSESFVLQIKDLKTGCLIPKLDVEGVVSLAWAQSGSTLLYTISDETQRPCRVFSTNINSDGADNLLFYECDVGCCVDITSTKDGKYITVNSNSRTSSEVYLLDAFNPHSELQLVRKRTPDVKYFVEHHHGLLYILTNAPLDNVNVAGSYYIARCQVGDLPLAEWQDIILPSPDVTFEDMDMFNGHLVLFLERKGFSMICSVTVPININCKYIMNFEDLHPWYFPVPSDTHNISSGSNHDFMAHIYRVVLSSPVMPDIVLDYDMLNKKVHVVHQEKISGITSNKIMDLFTHDVGNDLSEMGSTDNENFPNGDKMPGWGSLSDSYSCEKKEVVSYDGVKVPLTIIYSQKLEKNGKSPGILQGYGAYGEVLEKSWQSENLTLLDRGWIIAYADVRGGGGGTTSWHRDGTMGNKINSVHDFLACGSYLVNEGYVGREKLCAYGTSAGGLLVGASVNMKPYLFCAAILKVPFLDICNTLMDPCLPLTLLDHEEFGDPQNEAHFKFIRSYSPYDNIISKACYPAMLLTASFYDSRVGVWEAGKFVAKLREETCSNCSYSVILKTNMSGGHFGEGGRYSQCEEAAFEYAFLLKVVGMLGKSNRKFLKGYSTS